LIFFYKVVWVKYGCCSEDRPGLDNSESLKSQIDQHKFAEGHKICYILL